VHTEKQRIRAVFLLAFGSVFLISGIAGLLSLSTAYNIKSFGTVIALLSVIAGTYFLLYAYFVWNNKATRGLGEDT
jgi:uncharacterized membrane-anchored protein